MSALSVQPPFPIFTETDGLPLEDGYIWIGTANLNPITNPISVYWDAALTQPAVQPIRTLAGYPSNAGTPARLYVNSNYSIQVQNKSGSVIYSAPAATERLSSDLVTFIQAGSGAVERTAQSKMREIVSVKDFGAVGDRVTDDTAAIQAAIDANDFVYIPVGTYRVDGTIQARDFKSVWLEGNLIRKSVASSTAPIWQFNCQRGVLTGSGQLISEKDSPEGIVLFGSQDPASLPNQSNVLWNELSGVFIVGNQNPYVSDNSKGIAFRSVEAFGGPTVVYTNTVTNVTIASCSDSIYFGGQSNANVCSDIQFYRVGRYAVYFNGDDATTSPGTSNNQVNNFFVHFSSTAQAILKVVRSYQSASIGASGEPGGAGCRFYEIDNNSQRTIIVGADNCPVGPLDNSPNSGIFSSGQERIEFGVAQDYYRGAQIQAFRQYNAGFNPVGPGNFFLQAYNNSTTSTAYASLWLSVAGIGNDSVATLYAIDAGSGATEVSLTLKNGGVEQEAFHIDTNNDISFRNVKPLVDNTYDLGSGTYRWDTVYAVTPTINTSDANQKQDIAALDEAEKRVAVALKGLIKKFRFKGAVAEKGNKARIHVGVVAQEVKAAFETEGLDADRYALFCVDTLEDGSEIMGIRYDELLAFVISAI